MPSLVTTLHSMLAQADAHFRAGRVQRAQAAFAALIERAQDRADHPQEVIARSMLAHCYLKRRDEHSAREELQTAAVLLDPGHIESYGRYRAVLARLAVASDSDDVSRQELVRYVDWAEKADAHANVVDGCQLLATRGPLDTRVTWLQRGIDHALEYRVPGVLGHAYNLLAILLDQDHRREEAFEAYQQAYTWQAREGQPRQHAAAAWAVGAMALALDDYALARTRFEEALDVCRREDAAGDVLVLVLADLAQVQEASDDIIEARRLLIEAARLAREHQLPTMWPARWRAMAQAAKRLEIDV